MEIGVPDSVRPLRVFLPVVYAPSYTLLAYRGIL